MSKERKVLAEVRNMVDFMKDEVDRAVASMVREKIIESHQATTVSTLLKSTLEASMIKTSGMIQKAVTAE